MKPGLLTVVAMTVAMGCAGAGNLRAAVPNVSTPPTPRLHGYLKRDAIDGVTAIGPPPAMDTIRGKADREIYLNERKEAGSPRWAQAVRDDDLWTGGAVGRFSCALGVRLAPQTTPRTDHLLRQIEMDVRNVGTPPKDFYGRPRPMLDDNLPICVPREDWMKTNGSYPSGHSMTGWAWALVLGELAPRKVGSLMQAGGAIGDSRIICGVHYQSDVEAGRKLGAAMVARLHAEPAFLKDLAAAKAELRRTQTAPPMDCPAT